MSDDEFELQLQQEAEERERNEKLKAGKVKVDPDGTVYEWDEEKKAWFPRVDEDFIARYQMSYGTDVTSTESSNPKTSDAPPSVTDPGYAEWYHKYYSNYDGTGGAVDTNSKEYREWYEYYYGDSAKSDAGLSQDNDSKSADTEKAKSEETGEPPEKRARAEEGEDSGVSKEKESTEAAQQQQSYEDYYAYYYQQYGQYPNAEQAGEESSTKLDPSHPDYWSQYHSMQSVQPPTDAGNQDPKPEADGKNSTETDKKGTKKSAPQPVAPPTWFEMDQSKNTSVYVTGLPPDYTEDKFVSLMNKCGLIMYDPRTRKPKVKLYKNKDGENKGDGRCCYIKQESVDLALQFLDGSDVDGFKINVEVAKFELKGTYDPSKKKKKLTNSERKKFKEKQEKLFDWRPDKPRGTRSKHEKVVIIKNFFHPEDFSKNPALINELRQDLREECQKYGEVKKVTIFDRHPDGTASVTFKTAEEADVCMEALDRRYFAGKRLLVETWDGKTKYEVEETEEQRRERLSKWEKYLEEETKTKERQERASTGDSGKQEVMETQNSDSTSSVHEGGAVQVIEDSKEEESGASS